MPSQLLESLVKDGFVVIPSILTASSLESLRNAAEETITIARSGNWPQVRTLPKQFPPWNIAPGANPAADGIWGVQGLMNPALPAYQAFVTSYFSDEIMDIAEELLSCTDEDLVMELFNMLVRPDRDFELRWHRDDIPATASPEEEEERLKKPAFHAQWNLALYDDASLLVVPGSHVRARTEVERAADPFEKEIPGQMVVKLMAGDAVFYNNNILHRGVYDSTVERMTLHGSVGHIKGSALRARNVLQHGIGEWVEKCDFSVLENKQRARAEGMRTRLIDLGKTSGDVGYSQQE